MDILLDAGYPVGSKSREWWNCSGCCRSEGDLKLSRFLLETGADPKIALRSAQKTPPVGNTEMLELVLAKLQGDGFAVLEAFQKETC